MTLSPQDVDFDKNWEELKKKVMMVLTLQSGVTGMVIFEGVYKICVSKQSGGAEKLYNSMKKLLEDHVTEMYWNMKNRQSGLLGDYLEKWKQYEDGSRFTSNMFNYLNKNYVKDGETHKKMQAYSTSKQDQKLFPIYNLALIAWKNHLFDKIKDRLNRDILQAITSDRDGAMIDHHEVSGIIASLVKLGSIIRQEKITKIYEEDFEENFLQNTKEYYSMESTNFIATHGVSEYLKKAEERLKEEEERAVKFLHHTSVPKVITACNQVLISNHKELLDVECNQMLIEDRRNDLHRMFLLLNRMVGGINSMTQVFETYVTDTGMRALNAFSESMESRTKVQPSTEKKPTKEEEDDSKASDPSQIYVDILLKTHKQFEEMVKTCFNNEPNFVSSLDKACRKIVNQDPLKSDKTKPPELIAKFTDSLLRKSTNHMDENELENKISQIIMVFKYVDDKDVFQKFYAQHLTKRLINGTSISDDAEKLMIAGLREACGFEYTSKLQRMFNDMGLSKDVNNKFRDNLTERGINLGLDFNVMVLTSGSWPLFGQRSNFNIPAQLEQCIHEFTEYYKSQNAGRRLNWLHHLAKGDLKTYYTKVQYDIQATNYQLSVLLLFNNAKELTEIEIKELLLQEKVNDPELKRTIKSLVDFKLLSAKRPAEGQPILYILNVAFVSKRRKFKITAPMQKDTNVQNDATRNSIAEERKMFLQALIVRVMKARKTLKHQELMQEVISHAKNRFQPHIPTIKRSIEILIEKEYLVRLENDEYSYVA